MKRSTPLKRGKPLKRSEFKKATQNPMQRSTSLPKQRKRLPHKSTKTTLRDEELSRMTALMMMDDPTCHVRSPVCTGYMSCLHHVVARSVAPSRVLDPTNVVRSCSACNAYVETADGGVWAEACGMKRRSYE